MPFCISVHKFVCCLFGFLQISYTHCTFACLLSTDLSVLKWNKFWITDNLQFWGHFWIGFCIRWGKHDFPLSEVGRALYWGIGMHSKWSWKKTELSVCLGFIISWIFYFHLTVLRNSFSKTRFLAVLKLAFEHVLTVLHLTLLHW